jgi:hypothetical protein
MRPSPFLFGEDSTRVHSTIIAALLMLAPGFGPESSRPELPPELAKVAKEYNITVVCGDPGFPTRSGNALVDGLQVDASKIANYAKLFGEEFSVYPSEAVRRCRLRRVVLCNELTVEGRPCGAIADPEHATLYFDVSYQYKTEKLRRSAIHHEFFHMIDYSSSSNLRQDRWVALNPPAFKYGTGGLSAQDNPTSGVLTDKYPGFLNHYSTTAVAEDKAEVFANLIVNAGYVKERISHDQVLKAKVACMKELVIDFCRDLHDGFLERARKLDRSQAALPPGPPLRPIPVPRIIPPAEPEPPPPPRIMPPAG